MSKRKTAAVEAKEEFQLIKDLLPRGWISLYLDKYYKHLRGAAAYNKGRSLENIRNGTTAPSRQELSNMRSFINAK